MIRTNDILLSSTYNFESAFLQELDEKENEEITREVRGRYKNYTKRSRCTALPIISIISICVALYCAALAEGSLEYHNNYSTSYRGETSYKYIMIFAVGIPLIIGIVAYNILFNFGKNKILKEKIDSSFNERRLLSIKKKLRDIEQVIEDGTEQEEKEELNQAKDFFDLKVLKYGTKMEMS